jgi:hypothetical protein
LKHAGVVVRAFLFGTGQVTHPPGRLNEAVPLLQNGPLGGSAREGGRYAAGFGQRAAGTGVVVGSVHAGVGRSVLTSRAAAVVVSQQRAYAR